MHQPRQYPGVFSVVFKVGVSEIAHPVEIGAGTKVPALGAQQQGMGAFGERLTMKMGQFVEAIEQPQHELGIKGVVASGA
ncbi:hypothetical protein LMBIIBHN_01832 [Aeromonas salmonicida]